MKKIALLLLSFTLTLSADECPKKEICITKKEVVTDFSAKVGGMKLDYTATTGVMPLYNKKGEAEAEIFYVAYTKKGGGDRPITFCFNGGPGASSAWLHLGVFGPKKLAFSSEGVPLKPYRIEDNPHSILDQTDLVFIDPVSTGHSRAAEGVDAKKFHGVESDIKSVAEFIRSFLTTNGRWGSPKFLAGESYGTTRAAGLANTLFDDLHITVDGIILVSCILDFQAYRFDIGNDIPYITFLPTYAAINWYHTGKNGSLDSVIKEAEEYALGPYGTALLKGNSISKSEKIEVAQQLARITGVDAEFIERADIRVDWLEFAKRRFYKEGKVVSRFDGRFLGYDEDLVSCYTYDDATFNALAPAFTSAINQYFYKDLKWKRDAEYEVLASVQPWDYSKRATNKYLNMNKDVAELLVKTPSVKIFVANGYFDLATPFMGSTYTFNHLPIAKELQKNISFANYEAGHMMYIKGQELIKLSKDTKKFITGALGERSEAPRSRSSGRG